GGAQASGKAHLAAAARPRVRAALSHGLTLRLTGVTATKVTLTARANGVTVAKGSARVSHGTATVRLLFTTVARKRLGKQHGSLRLTITGAGITTTVTLKR